MVAGTSKKNVVELRYVPGSVDVQVGQMVYTTGQDGIYPPGLKIGEIVQVVSGLGNDTAPDIYPAESRDRFDAGGRHPALRTGRKEEFEQKIRNAGKK